MLDGERESPKARLAFTPFGAGGRTCVGNQFALMEGMLLALIGQRSQLTLVREHPVEPELVITLRPRYGLKMMVTPRAGLRREAR